MKISLCMIVKNEQDTLGRCLQSVQSLVQEIIVVDTGSTDDTKSIATKFGAHVVDFEWVHDFSAARNFSFAQAHCEYIMWLDADDIILPNDAKKLRKLQKNYDKDTDVFMLKYKLMHHDRLAMSFYRERILKKSCNFVWQEPVHEVITPHGNKQYFDIAITHLGKEKHASDRNLRIYEMHKHDLSARAQFYYARELSDNGHFEQAANMFEQFLHNPLGWIENKIEACKNLGYCYGRLGKQDKQLTALLHSFTFDVPRAEILCDIGAYFMQQQKFEQAKYFYLLATKCKPNLQSGAFCLHDAYSFVPNLALCVCYNQLGDNKKAALYNQKAAKIYPNDAHVLHNQKYFEGLSQQDK